MEIVLASHNQLLYRATISGPEGIADLVGDRHCDALTTAGGFQFWFAATSRGAGRLNGPATKLLFVHQTLRPAVTPLLRGTVVVARRSAAGPPTELTAEQACALVAPLDALSRRNELTIERRLRRTANADRRANHRRQMESAPFELSRSARAQANWRLLRRQLSPDSRW